MNSDENSYKIALDWIKMIENPAARAKRDLDIYPRLRAWAAGTQGSVLEVGAGQGVASEILDLKDRSYLGVEPSPILLQRAQELYQKDRAQFTSGSAEKIPVSDESVENLFSISVWHLVADVNMAAQESARVLKPSGNFLLIVPNPAAYKNWTALYQSPRQEGSRFEGLLPLSDGTWATETLFLHPLETIHEALENASLKVHHSETFRPIDDGFLFLQLQGQKI